MRWDEAFLTTFAPAAGRAQQATYDAERQRSAQQYDAERTAAAQAYQERRDSAALDAQMQAYNRQRADHLADSLRKEQADKDRLDLEMTLRRRDNQERLRIADDQVKAASAADQQRLAMEGMKLDAALFDKKVSEYAANMADLDEPSMLLAGKPLLAKRAQGLPLSLDERAILAAGERVLAARRAPQYEKVVESGYQLGPDGKVLADAEGKPITTLRREFTQRRMPPAAAYAAPGSLSPPAPAPVSTITSAATSPSGALAATGAAYQVYSAETLAAKKRLAEAEAARAAEMRKGVAGAEYPAAMWRGPAM